MKEGILMKENSLKLISVIVPCFNEEKAISLFYEVFKSDTKNIIEKGYLC